LLIRCRRRPCVIRTTAASQAQLLQSSDTKSLLTSFWLSATFCHYHVMSCWDRWSSCDTLPISSVSQQLWLTSHKEKLLRKTSWSIF